MGTLYAPDGYVSALQCDPIEKKPFYHVLPGSTAMSFGMLGCSLHCAYCQNWLTSQALRDPQSRMEFRAITAAEIVRRAVAGGASAVVSTYNEPLITAEWAARVFREARAANLMTGFVSNGNATPEVLAYLRPWLDLFKVDLKTMDDGRYHQLGGRLRPVLDSIAAIHGMGFWLEVVTLIVPGFNDSRGELEAMARFLAGVSPDIPWHVTAFYRAYRMQAAEGARPNDLLRAALIGRDAGLRYVYAGNLPGSVGDWENTRCAGCGTLVVERRGFHVVANRLTFGGACPSCGRSVPGLWTTRAGSSTADPRWLASRCG
jgi:pyruvate formate lyase activating enzyme